MIIDAHAHLAPKSWFHPRSPRAIFDIDGLLEKQANAQIDLTVFGNNWIRIPEASDVLDLVKEFNEFAVEVTASSDPRLRGPQGNRPRPTQLWAQGHHDQLQR